jgi:hypothetical protein
MMAYLSMVALRLIELRRVLKPTGSIYLRCDPTESLKFPARSLGIVTRRSRPR